jgi:redox-sensitive bicupin YhaK (pirin superfamily)
VIAIRRAQERGHAQHGWLDTHHTFSFADYYDPAHMGWRDLRVINEDVVQPGKGFPTHSHRDMEIVTWLLGGSLQHRDSMGNGSVLRPGELQRMSAGTGVTHSEFNPSQESPVHLLQIWILPERLGIAPSYEQKSFPAAQRSNALRLLASRDGRQGSVHVHQDVDLYASLLDPGRSLRHELRPGRALWLQVARGALDVQGVRLAAGDGAAIEQLSALEICAEQPSELLLFDLH